MKKRNFHRGAIFFVAAASVAIAALFCSCVREEYNLRRPLDLTLQVGGDSLSLPLGVTDRLTIDSLLGAESLSDILVVNEAGEYVLSLDSLSISENIDEVPIKAFLLDSIGTLKDFDVQMSLPAAGASLATKAVARTSEVAGDVYQTIDLDFEFDDISEVVQDLQYMYFVEKTRVRVLFELVGAAQIDMNRVRPELVVQLPENFHIEDPLVDEHNQIHVQRFDEPGRFYFDLPLNGLDLSKTEMTGRKLHYKSVLVLSGKLLLQEDNVSARESATEVTLQSKVLYSVVDLEPSRVKGHFSLSIPPQRLSVELGQMPDMFTDPDAVLDFARPHILIKISTNTGVAVNAHLKIVPVYGGAPDALLTQDALLQIPAGDVNRMHTYRFWLAKDREGMPADCLFADMDVSAILKRMPDSLQVWVDVASDMTQTHEYVFGQNSVLQAGIKPEVPLAFGPDLNIPYENTFSGLGNSITSLLEGNQMEVIAEVTNSLPLAIQINLDLLGSDGETIPVCTTG
ncbi:MAG: hypothetical protein K2I66_03695, partial [Bacteroidales bacterium]|nr:hypothetical protein [Bacteroidales bacterium]